ncbi:hypothetical protein SAMN02745866_00455 [Alteromonadaceae bacterium Bs31]|nr:hypothetical protein SAMN02745866_00455 [Alteromonadaceae bacterium Bs31]
MTDFPLNVVSQFGPPTAYFIYAILGFFFGFILESAGFGNSRKLAAQFYFKELTVFKVMFTAIIVAMVLIFLSSAIGLLDYKLLWVNPTYLWPGIIGGLIMGVGFIVGGFCPGTSLVAAATLKVDGIFFVAGALFGIFVFGESVDYYNIFFNSSYMGRLTLPDVFSLSYGAVVLLIVIMALLMFLGAEWLERAMNQGQFSAPTKWRVPAAFVLVSLAVITMALGQPSLPERWQWISKEYQIKIDNREIYASPLELASLQNNRKLRVELLDIRPESDFNHFHIRDAQHTDTRDLEQLADTLIALPGNTVTFLASNDENFATEVWKLLRAAGVPNLYVLEGGVNGWIKQFAPTEFTAPNDGEEKPAFFFKQALGERYPMASPNLADYELDFTAVVKLEIKRAPEGGGCG